MDRYHMVEAYYDDEGRLVKGVYVPADTPPDVDCWPPKFRRGVLIILRGPDGRWEAYNAYGHRLPLSLEGEELPYEIQL